jgi:ribonuclease HII
LAPYNSADLYAFDRIIEKEHGCIVVGTDEAGRGPLAGPVVAAAVRLNLHDPIDGINDSKKLSAGAREQLYETITAQSAAWAVGSASVEEIDRYNILQASLLAMKRALDSLNTAWSKVLVDGNKTIKNIAPEHQLTVVKGDGKSASIAAASIIAKVTRDRLMEQLHEQYPVYGFGTHKGYPTEEHRAMILHHGLCPIHRRSFCTNSFVQTSLAL